MNKPASLVPVTPRTHGKPRTKRISDDHRREAVIEVGNRRVYIRRISQSEMVLNITADRERFPALRPGKIQKFGLPYAGNVDAVVEEADGARLRVAFCKPISRAKARLALSGRPVEDALLDEIEQLQAGHSHPKFSTVPEWLLWVVLLVTTLFVLFFVYSLSSLIVGG